MATYVGNGKTEQVSPGTESPNLLTTVEADSEPIDYKYVNALPRSVLCCVCEKVLRNPVQSTCGERSCESCFKSMLRFVVRGEIHFHMPPIRWSLI